MLCSRCKKRVAMIFLSKMENGKPVNEGLCLKCAKELNLPQVTAMMEQMGITDDDIDAISDQMTELANGDSFEPGGNQTMPAFLQNMMNGVGEMMQSMKQQGDNLPANPPAPKTGNAGKRERREQPKKYKFLDSFCTNLTERARKGQLDNIVGRDREIYRVVQILSRRSKNNPCLIGEPGVGKTAIAEGIAQRIAGGNVPFRLQDKQLYLLDMTSLVAGTQFRGQFESRVKGLLDDIKKAGNVILFIDEIHTIVGTGDSEGSMSAANILKPALSRGEVQVIGATTFNEYRKHIEKDSALERRFQPVTVNEPTLSETVQVLKGIRRYYEQFHRVKVSDYIVDLAVKLSERYINDRFLPDKAIDLLDEACSCRSLRAPELTEYEKLNQTLKELTVQESELEGEEVLDYEKIAQTKSEILSCREKLKELEPKVANIPVEVDDVARVIELWTGIPASKIKQNEFEKIIGLEDRLKKRVVGQDEAIHEVVNAIKRSRIQLSPVKRPASFIFVGPTGVGKTELVKSLASELFDSVDPLIRLDMTEYMEKHTVSKLIGSPPGYVGYDEAGQLTEKVRRKPYSVILFDEIEKAHPDVMNILLQMLDEGRITDSQGRTVDFSNTVICMTSNAGSSDKSGVVGFGKSENDISKEKAMRGLKEFLRPEFLGRVDEVVVFHNLGHEQLKLIAALKLDEMKPSLLDRGITFQYDDAALEKLAKLSDDGAYSARDLQKVIRKEVEDSIAALLMSRYENPPKLLALTCVDDQIQLVTD
ncbi:MAG TPA: AAA family ATPase [Candidatus Egerieicola faecale]|uniref:AAA family ATPase n=1 Tax=Candidatus Egerieicola faecale TaxID=2840774 RepID=A0A9D1IQS5_9FIRM|nr:AAA family ATPase [Candidatus Egerieicola faecale]